MSPSSPPPRQNRRVNKTPPHPRGRCCTIVRHRRSNQQSSVSDNCLTSGKIDATFKLLLYGLENNSVVKRNSDTNVLYEGIRVRVEIVCYDRLSRKEFIMKKHPFRKLCSVFFGGTGGREEYIFDLNWHLIN